MAATLRQRGSKAHRAVTLLEVLVAVTILAIMGTAIFGVVRTTTRGHATANQDALMLQQARAVFDALRKDIAAVHYREEDTYNIYMQAVLTEYERARAEAEDRGDWRDFEARYGPSDDRRGGKPQGWIGNPFEKGQLIDLSFMGEESMINFARARPYEMGSPEFPLGLSRVTYRLSGTALVRSEEDVYDRPRTWDGEPQSKEEPPRHELLAEGISRLEFSYSFWYDSQWYETREWNSSDRRIRNARFILNPDSQKRGRKDQPADPRFAGGGLQPGDPGWNEYINTLRSEPLDKVPSYVRVRLTIGDPKNPKRMSRTYQTTIFVPTTQETYAFDAQMDRRFAEDERQARDEKYLPVDPGAMLAGGR